VQIKDGVRKGLKPRFLYHQLASEKFFAYDMQHAKGAKMPRGDKDAIMKYEIAIPRLEEQERIVSILDKFDALVNDLSTGLPAELNARRQQYQHYRDRLLTFREAA
jgi:type I restriction enzyme S subunit